MQVKNTKDIKPTKETFSENNISHTLHFMLGDTGVMFRTTTKITLKSSFLFAPLCTENLVCFMIHVSYVSFVNLVHIYLTYHDCIFISGKLTWLWLSFLQDYRLSLFFLLESSSCA